MKQLGQGDLLLIAAGKQADLLRHIVCADCQSRCPLLGPVPLAAPADPTEPRESRHPGHRDVVRDRQGQGQSLPLSVLANITYALGDAAGWPDAAGVLELTAYSDTARLGWSQ